MIDKEIELGSMMIEVGKEENERAAASMSNEVSALLEVSREAWKEKWLGILDKVRKYKSPYIHYMAILLHGLVKDIEWGEGYRWEVVETERGVVFKMKKGSKVYVQGIEPTGEPNYDFQAMVTVSLRAENTVDRLEGRDSAAHDLKNAGLVIPT